MVTILMATIVVTVKVTNKVRHTGNMVVPLLFMLFLKLKMCVFSLPNSSTKCHCVFAVGPGKLLSPEL